MTEYTYSIRSMLIEKERHFRLDPDALVWTSERGEGRIAYGDVASVQVFTANSTYGRASNCTIRQRRGRRLVFGTVHFVNATSVENRAAQYGPFVRALCRRVAEAGPRTAFFSGSRSEYIMLGVGLAVLIGIGLFMLALLVASNIGPNIEILGVFAVFVALIPITGGFMRSRKPVAFDPRAIPDDLVGPEAPSIGETAAMS